MMIEKIKLTDDEESMLHACGYSEEDVDWVFRGFIDAQVIHSGEHSEMHNTPDGIESYLRSIPPVIRVWDGIGMRGNDGNHRINTCDFYNKQVPCSIIYLK
jgi:hypothetical protein